MTPEQRQQLVARVLQNMKLVLKVPADDICNDKLYSHYIDSVIYMVLTYCAREDMPQELEHLLVRMAIQLQKSGLEPQVSQISRGDVSVSFSSQESSYNATSGAGGADFLNNYVKQLNNFRKLRW